MEIKGLEFEAFIPQTCFTVDANFPINECLFINFVEYSSGYDVPVTFPEIRVGDHISAVTTCNVFSFVVKTVRFEQSSGMGQPGWFVRCANAKYDGAFNGFGQHWNVFRPFIDLDKLNNVPVASSTGARTFRELRALHKHNDNQSSKEPLPGGKSKFSTSFLNKFRASFPK